MARHNSVSDVKRKIKERDFESLFQVKEDDDSKSYYYDMLTSVFIDSDIDPRLYYEHRYTGAHWYTLAYKYYGNVDYYWLILLANQIQNPFQKIPNGTILKIPNGDLARFIVEKVNNQKLDIVD